jgi:hypothetical protein
MCCTNYTFYRSRMVRRCRWYEIENRLSVNGQSGLGRVREHLAARLENPLICELSNFWHSECVFPNPVNIPPRCRF